MALADTYDALTSKRIYKDAFTHEEACAAVVKGRGSHFDPVMVEAFLANEEKFVAIGRSLSDTADEPSLLTV